MFSVVSFKGFSTSVLNGIKISRIMAFNYNLTTNFHHQTGQQNKTFITDKIQIKKRSILK